jgi:hypothetical protein
MNIHELSRRSGLSLTKLRKLERLGVLNVDAEHDAAERLRWQIGRNPKLTLSHALELYDDPTIFDSLANYEARVREQFAKLGKVEPAPKLVAFQVVDASAGKVDAARAIAAWLRSVLPVEPVPYLWIALRLTCGLSGEIRKGAVNRANTALAHVRRLDEFAGYWHEEREAGKISIRYHKPLDYAGL